MRGLRNWWARFWCDHCWHRLADAPWLFTHVRGWNPPMACCLCVQRERGVERNPPHVGYQPHWHGRKPPKLVPPQGGTAIR